MNFESFIPPTNPNEDPKIVTANIMQDKAVDPETTFRFGVDKLDDVPSSLENYEVPDNLLEFQAVMGHIFNALEKSFGNINDEMIEQTGIKTKIEHGNLMIGVPIHSVELDNYNSQGSDINESNMFLTKIINIADGSYVEITLQFLYQNKICKITAKRAESSGFSNGLMDYDFKITNSEKQSLYISTDRYGMADYSTNHTMGSATVYERVTSIINEAARSRNISPDQQKKLLKSLEGENSDPESVVNELLEITGRKEGLEEGNKSYQEYLRKNKKMLDLVLSSSISAITANYGSNEYLKGHESSTVGEDLIKYGYGKESFTVLDSNDGFITDEGKDNPLFSF